LEASDAFHQLMALGLTVTIGLQAIIIMAGNLKLIPLTGITLPFISYGGSSLMANFVILGLLLRLSDDNRSARRSTPPSGNGEGIT
jgi:cell division protein FtsW (lipid II flippase)